MYVSLDANSRFLVTRFLKESPHGNCQVVLFVRRLESLGGLHGAASVQSELVTSRPFHRGPSGREFSLQPTDGTPDSTYRLFED